MTTAPPVPDPISRRALAAIVFTDIVGYSARMSTNETATLRACQRDLALMHQICKESNGQVLKSTGDGLLMYFASAVDAVRCAMKIQKRITSDAAKLRPEEALKHRIGIHVGDVFFSKRDVMGDGVNVAARLQEQAEPGGIVISSTAYDLVKGRVEVQATYLGPRELKNIKEQVGIYQLLLSAQAVEDAAAAKRSTGSTKRMLSIVAALLLLAALGVAGAMLIPPMLQNAAGPSPSAKSPPPTVEEIAQMRHVFADRYDYRGMLQWIKDKGVEDSLLAERFTELAMLRDTFEQAMAQSSAEQPIDVQIKTRVPNPLQMVAWRTSDGQITLKRQRTETQYTLEKLPKLDMLVILFALGKDADEHGVTVDSRYRDALIHFAEEHRITSPLLNRIRQSDVVKDKLDSTKDRKGPKSQ